MEIIFYRRPTYLHIWYLSFRTMVPRGKELKRHHNRISVIRSLIPERILLKPNETYIEAKEFIDREMNYPTTIAIIHDSEEADLTEFIGVSSSVIQYQYGKKHME